MTTVLRQFYGRAGANGVLRVIPDATDDAVPFPIVAQSDPVAPNSEDGACLFHGVRLTVTRAGAETLRVQPIVDGVAYAPVDVAVLAPTADRPQTDVYEVGFRQLVSAGLVGRVFAGLRGVRFQARLTLPLGVGAPLWIDGVELDYEPVAADHRDALPVDGAGGWGWAYGEAYGG